jgi:hypothetical protein
MAIFEKGIGIRQKISQLFKKNAGALWVHEPGSLNMFAQVCMMNNSLKHGHIQGLGSYKDVHEDSQHAHCWLLQN